MCSSCEKLRCQLIEVVHEGDNPLAILHQIVRIILPEAADDADFNLSVMLEDVSVLSEISDLSDLSVKSVLSDLSVNSDEIHLKG